MAAPTWSAARNGFPGDPTAVDKSEQINQLLNTSTMAMVYEGAQILRSTTGLGLGGFFPNPDGNQFDQPFTLAGTTVGRVTLPIRPVGDGADLLVSLCPDDAGSPGTPIVSCRLPAKWIKSMAAAGPIPGRAAGAASAVNNSLRFANVGTSTFAAPQVSTQAFLRQPSVVTTTSGWFICVGGEDSFSFGALANVYTAPIRPDGTLGALVPQPPLPAAAFIPGVVVTDDDTVVVVGGEDGLDELNTVYTAQLNTATGQIGSWSEQTTVPVGGQPLGMAVYQQHVYVISMFTPSDPVTPETNAVYHGVLNNGIISTWDTFPTPGFPVGGAVVGNRLVVPEMFSSALAGPGQTHASASTAINPDGSLGEWHVGPSVDVATVYFLSGATDSGVVMFGGEDVNTGDNVTTAHLFSVDSTGLELLTQQSLPVAANGLTSGQLVPIGDSRWVMVALNVDTTTLVHGTVHLVPAISVPLPATGLTDGGTYHVLMRQQGGDLSNYLEFWAEFAALPDDGLWRPAGGGAWSGDFLPIRPPDVPAAVSYEFPIGVYDGSAAGQLRHVYDDTGDRVITTVPAADGTLFAVAEATMFDDDTQLPAVDAIFYDDTGRRAILAQAL